MDAQPGYGLKACPVFGLMNPADRISFEFVRCHDRAGVAQEVFAAGDMNGVLRFHAFARLVFPVGNQAVEVLMVEGAWGVWVLDEHDSLLIRYALSIPFKGLCIKLICGKPQTYFPGFGPSLALVTCLARLAM